MIRKNILLLIRNNYVLFILFILLQVVSCISLIFSYCQYRETRFDLANYNSNAGKFDVEFSDVSLLPFMEFVNNCELKPEKIEIYLDSARTVMSVPVGEHMHVNFGMDFSNTSEREAIIPIQMQVKENLSVGEYIKVLGMDYKIVGMRNSDTIELKYISLPENIKIFASKIYLDKIPTEVDIKNFNSKIYENFDNVLITNPPKRDVIAEIGFDSSVLSAILLTLLSIINITFIYSYLIKQRQNALSIYRMCGITKNKLLFYNIVETLLYLLISIILSLMFFNFVLKKLLFDNVISFYDYIVPSTAFLLMSFFVIFEKIVALNKDDPIKKIMEDV